MEQKLFDFGNDLTLLMDKYSLSDYTKIPNHIMARYVCECLESLRIVNHKLTKHYERLLEDDGK